MTPDNIRDICNPIKISEKLNTKLSKIGKIVLFSVSSILSTQSFSQEFEWNQDKYNNLDGYFVWVSDTDFYSHLPNWWQMIDYKWQGLYAVLSENNEVDVYIMPKEEWFPWGYPEKISVEFNWKIYIISMVEDIQETH